MKTDKRKLKLRKPIIKVEHNERSDEIFVEVGANTTSEDVITGIVYQIEVVAERMGLGKKQLFNMIGVSMGEAMGDEHDAEV